jgi:hypothetical protein
MVVDGWCRLGLGSALVTVGGDGWRRLVLDGRGHVGGKCGPTSPRVRFDSFVPNPAWPRYRRAAHAQQGAGVHGPVHPLDAAIVRQSGSRRLGPGREPTERALSCHPLASAGYAAG